VVPAIRSVPVPVGYDANRLAAFNRINEARAAAGLGLLEQAVLLDAAAQAHADWQLLNGICSHGETSGTPGFTGADSLARIAFQGYHSSGGGGEVIGYTVGIDAAGAIDGLLNAFYHREFMLMPSFVDVGIGASNQYSPICAYTTVVELDRPGDELLLSWGQSMRAEMEPISVWPVDGAVGVPLLMGNENPNPVPGRPVSELGTPATLIADYWKKIDVEQFTMTESLSGLSVDVVLRTADNDPNHEIFSNYAGIIPTAGLKPLTTYVVQFAGLVGNQPVKKHWTFTTGLL
jgi:hypothetical protein